MKYSANTDLESFFERSVLESAAIRISKTGALPELVSLDESDLERRLNVIVDGTVDPYYEELGAFSKVVPILKENAVRRLAYWVNSEATKVQSESFSRRGM